MDQTLPLVAAVILAAGSSRRFGAANKLLAEVDGEPLVRRVAKRIIAVAPHEIVIVTGHERLAVEAALAKLSLRFVENLRHAEGIGSSIATGIASLSDDVDGAFICLGDMPETDPALLKRMLAAFAAARSHAVIVPGSAEGRQGNPVLWPVDLFSELTELSGDAGAKRLIGAHQARVVRVTTDADGAFRDIDTEAELARYRARPQTR